MDSSKSGLQVYKSIWKFVFQLQDGDGVNLMRPASLAACMNALLLFQLVLMNRSRESINLNDLM